VAEDASDVLRRTAGANQQRLTAHQMVHDTLRSAILSGAMPGGTRLVQADIAATLDVSTTPVREALIQLASEGLIQFDPHRGAVVHEIDLDELREIYEIRNALEQIAVRHSAKNITAAQIDEAYSVIEAMDATREPGIWVQRNWDFHLVVELGAGAKRLASVLKTVQNSATLYVAHSVKVNPERMAEANHEHRALLEAVRRHDGDEAARIMGAHLDHTIQAIVRESLAGAAKLPGDA
jgi:DNA-binding GntR family transcriptional regulator